MNRWAWGWIGLLALVLGFEGAALLSPGEADTLTYHVTRMIDVHPELAGGAVTVLLAWLGYHWLVAPKSWNEDEEEGG